jgi:hypothetical protein
MAKLALSTVPASGSELEEYVAGLFQSAGWFLERNIRRRDVADVFELDVVATRYDGPKPTSVLAEAKGGRWGFTDLFKIAGWMQYLGIERGAFFVRGHPATAGRDSGALRRTASPLRVSFVDLGDFSDPARRFGEGGFAGRVDPVLLEVWRYSYRVERALLEGVRADRRSAPERKGALTVLEYHDLVNDEVFFARNARERLRRLYDAYRRHPRLSAAVAAELSGDDFRAAMRALRRPGPQRSLILAEALYEGRHSALQASLYVEHRARLAILKAAVDASCGEPASRAPLDALPATFREGLSRLRSRSGFRRYALLWQVFLWGFGGFYLADREGEELAWLARQAGLPRSEVDAGLSAFDELFPLAKGSWIVPVADTPIRLCRMVPVAFRGVGAVQRLRRRGERNYDHIAAGGVARRNLIAWHNGLIRLLAHAPPQSAEA